MALVSDVASSWSPGVTLAAQEFWQVRSGEALVTHETSPVEGDGLYLAAGQGITFASGQTIKYRRAGTSATIITRTVVA